MHCRQLARQRIRLPLNRLQARTKIQKINCLRTGASTATRIRWNVFQINRNEEKIALLKKHEMAEVRWQLI